MSDATVSFDASLPPARDVGAVTDARDACARTDARVDDAARARGGLDFASHEVRRIDRVAIPPDYRLTRRLTLTSDGDGLDGVVELWGFAATRKVHWDPTDTRHDLFRGWLAGAEGPRGVGILRVLDRDGVVLGQLGFEGGLVDMQRHAVPSRDHPSFMVDVDNVIGMGSWAGVETHLVAFDRAGPRIETARDDADRTTEPMSFLASLRYAWQIHPGPNGASAAIESRGCDTWHEPRRIASQRFTFDARGWHVHHEPLVRVDDCPEY